MLPRRSVRRASQGGTRHAWACLQCQATCACSTCAVRRGGEVNDPACPGGAHARSPHSRRPLCNQPQLESRKIRACFQARRGIRKFGHGSNLRVRCVCLCAAATNRERQSPCGGYVEARSDESVPVSQCATLGPQSPTGTVTPQADMSTMRTILQDTASPTDAQASRSPKRGVWGRALGGDASEATVSADRARAGWLRIVIQLHSPTHTQGSVDSAQVAALAKRSVGVSLW